MQMLTFWMFSSLGEGEDWQPPAADDPSTEINGPSQDDRPTSIWTVLRNEPIAASVMYSCMAMQVDG